MLSYTFLVGIPILFFFIANRLKSRKLEILGLFIFSIILGLRYNFGVDYSGYYLNYNNINILDNEKYKFSEPAFYYLNTLFGNFSFNLMLFFIALVTLFLFYSRIKNDRDRTLIVFIFLLYSGSYLLQIVALRQGIAAMIFFYSIEYINQRNFKKYFFGILIAALFHNSAIFLLFIYFLKNITRKTLYIILLLGLILSNYYILNPILLLLKKISFMAIYINYLQYTKPIFGTGLGFIFTILFTILFIYFYNRIRDERKIYYLIFLFSFFISILNTAGMPVLRFKMYFAFFAMIAIPELINSFTQRENRIILKVFTVLFLIANFYTTIYSYKYSNDPLAVEYLSEFKLIISHKDQWENVTGNTFKIDGFNRYEK